MAFIENRAAQRFSLPSAMRSPPSSEFNPYYPLPLRESLTLHYPLSLWERVRVRGNCHPASTRREAVPLHYPLPLWERVTLHYPLSLWERVRVRGNCHPASTRREAVPLHYPLSLWERVRVRVRPVYPHLL
jgi:hypothetical protein